MDVHEMDVLRARLRSCELGLTRIRGHLIGIKAETDRALWMVERDRQLVQECLAQITLAMPRPPRPTLSRRRLGTTES